MSNEHDGQSSTEDEAPVESLIQGRAKRSTAGGRMSALLDAAADDELALLFEEVDDDNEFDMDVNEEAGEDENMGMESSSDDEDQGPNTRADDLEGEQQIQKEERAEKKKRRAQQDLRYKIASKKVKIDPTAVAAPPGPAPRPKKKSERISWIPTPEEGPTRSSSRRQTMQNKEMTHARLKDSEEKRIRLIATMEEAAKRKAHLKPKEMTQAERLAEAERVERLNSKSLNRWEEMEKRKAEERKAKIEALQNRRLEGPVMSYWSGIATWVNGRLTRVGKADIVPKPEKEDNTRRKSKKIEKEEKNIAEQKPAADTAPPPPDAQNITQATQSSTSPLPSGEAGPLKQPEDQSQPPNLDSNQADGVKPEDTAPKATAEVSVTPSAPSPARPSTAAPDNETKEGAAPETVSSKLDGAQKGETDQEATDNNPKDEKSIPAPAEDKPNESPKDAMQLDAVQMSGDASTTNTESGASEPSKNPDEDVKEVASGTPTVAPSKPEGVVETSKKVAEGGEETGLQSAMDPPLNSEEGSLHPANSPNTTPGAAPAPVDTSHSVEGASSPKDQENTEMHLDESAVVSEEAPKPEVPQPPPIIEKTGRNLTILENFDDKTAHSREFSIYFNAKRPPRLAKISSSLCVITSLPSRYRDTETALPFANAYAYQQIREAVDQKYIWSSMLGCYIGQAKVAAKGVPARFLDPDAPPPEPKESEKKEESAKETSTTEKEKTEREPKAPAPSGAASTPPPAPPATPIPVVAGGGEPMDIDKE